LNFEFDERNVIAIQNSIIQNSKLFQGANIQVC